MVEGPRSHGSHVVFLSTMFSAPSLWVLSQKLPGQSQVSADMETAAFLTAKGARLSTLPGLLGFWSGFKLVLLRSPCVGAITGGDPNSQVCYSGSSRVPIPLEPQVLSNKEAKGLHRICWCLRVLSPPFQVQ